MNEPDLKILRELQRDSDQSLDQISEQVGLSRNAVWKRIRTMEQNGVIASRVAILDAVAFDLNLTFLFNLRRQVAVNIGLNGWSAPANSCPKFRAPIG